jgi:hypothetical protein
VYGVVSDSAQQTSLSVIQQLLQRLPARINLLRSATAFFNVQIRTASRAQAATIFFAQQLHRKRQQQQIANIVGQIDFLRPGIMKTNLAFMRGNQFLIT